MKRMMISYRVMYQIRRREGVSISRGDWQDKEMRVVAGKDARDAVREVERVVHNNDFRLKSIEVLGQIDRVHGLD